MAKDDSALIKKMKVETAEKRRKQDEKKRVVNRTVKSKIHTARVAYKACAAEDKKKLGTNLQSLLDKAVKKKVLKKNTASRLKSRLLHLEAFKSS